MIWKTERSYLGISSCMLFGLATIGIAIDPAFGPGAVLLYVAGTVFSVLGLRKGAASRWSKTGLILNLIPLCYLITNVLSAIIDAPD
jgi:hypothetical protein